jgi:hypothetical protein
MRAIVPLSNVTKTRSEYLEVDGVCCLLRLDRFSFCLPRTFDSLAIAGVIYTSIRASGVPQDYQ